MVNVELLRKEIRDLASTNKIFPLVISLIITFLILGINPNVSLAEDLSSVTTMSISGTISLPSGVTAPAGGLEGKVYIYPEKFVSAYSNISTSNSYSTQFTLAEGGNSVQYTINVPIEAGITGYRVGYQLANTSSYAGYVSEGYYSSTGTVSSMRAELINPSANLPNINLMIYTGHSIKGKLSLPSMTAPAGGIDATICIISQNSGDEYSREVYIPEGSTSIGYLLTLPSTIGPSDYQVSYQLKNNYTGLLQNGYYSSQGSSPYYYEASAVHVGTEDVDNVDFSVLTGKTISGVVSLPQGLVAPDGGIVGTIYASVQYGSYASVFQISAGNSSANYTVTVPADTLTTDCRVAYYLNNGNDPAFGSTSYPGYLSFGYYSSTGTTRDYSLASAVNLNSGNVTGIDLTVLKGTIISGKISLPQGTAAPAGGINGYLRAAAPNGNGETTAFTILPGMSTADYVVTVPQDSSTGYILEYSLFDYSSNKNRYSGYVSEGYYSSQGTTSDPNLASTVDISGGDRTGIDFAMMKGTIIAGTITLAQGRAAPSSGIQGGIYVSSQSLGTFETNFYIPAGSASATYAVTVPLSTSVTDYRVNYNLYDNSGALVTNGYYSAAGTTADSQSASPVDVSNGDVNTINLMIKTGNMISGTIALPEGMTAPAGGISGYINVNPDQGGMSYSTAFSIPEGKGTADYQIIVSTDPSISKYRLIYSFSSENTCPFLDNLYYTDTGTTRDYNSATLIDVSTGDVTQKNISIMKGNVISGKVILPGGMVAPKDGIQGIVEIFPQNGGNSSQVRFNIPAGENAAAYSIAADPTVDGYTVNYSLWNNYSGFCGNGVFSSSGTVTNYNLATPVNVKTGDTNGIDLTLQKGTTISGTISLPEGDFAPTGGINGTIEFVAGDKSFNSYFYLPSGSHSTTYNITVPPNDLGQGYQVSYSIYSVGLYNPFGYYSASGTEYNSDSASLVDVSSSDATGIDLTLLKLRSISGTITLPQGMTAPSGGINGNIIVSEKNNATRHGVPFSIPEGSHSFSYTVSGLSGNSDYQISYELSNENGYQKIGYYSSSGTTTDYNSATPVDTSSGDAAGINMTILGTGTVTTPSAISVTLDNANLSLTTGGAIQLQATVTPDTVSNKSVTWSVVSQNPDGVITLSDSGLVTGILPGSAVVRATSTADPSKFADCSVTVTNPSASFSASPVIQVGVNPDAGNVAGMYVGFNNIVDAAGNPVTNAKISGYQIEIDFDPQQMSISEVRDETNSGSLFSQNIQISGNQGKVSVACASSNQITNYEKLFFIPMVLKGSAADQPTITIRYLNIIDPSLRNISVPTVDNSNDPFRFQRGRINNGATNPTPDISDVVAGLQYLADLRNAGSQLDEVNLVNMASITEPLNSTTAKPDVKDVIALLQYMVNLRDSNFQSAASRVASINVLSKELTLSSATTASAIGVVPYNVLDQFGNNITNSDLAKSVAFECNVASVKTEQGLLELVPLGGVDLRQLGQVVINGYDPQSGVTTSAALTIASEGSTTFSAINVLDNTYSQDPLNACSYGDTSGQSSAAQYSWVDAVLNDPRRAVKFG